TGRIAHDDRPPGIRQAVASEHATFFGRLRHLLWRWAAATARLVPRLARLPCPTLPPFGGWARAPPLRDDRDYSTGIRAPRNRRRANRRSLGGLATIHGTPVARSEPAPGRTRSMCAAFCTLHTAGTCLQEARGFRLGFKEKRLIRRGPFLARGMQIAPSRT